MSGMAKRVAASTEVVLAGNATGCLVRQQYTGISGIKKDTAHLGFDSLVPDK